MASGGSGSRGPREKPIRWYKVEKAEGQGMTADNFNSYGGHPVEQEKEQGPEPMVRADSVLDSIGVDDNGFDIMCDIPDIPMPEDDTNLKTIDDTFDSAVKFCFIGVGHAGGKLADLAWKLGYRRVCAINTSEQDLDALSTIPDAQKLRIGESSGAGKDRSVGRTAAKESAEDILDLMRRSFGPSFERIIVCASTGGGTGSGGFETVIDIANDLTEALRIKKHGEKTRVGLVVALPFNSERSSMKNAVEAMQYIDRALKEARVSPVSIVDNEKIQQIYSTIKMKDLWPRANSSFLSLFDLFNKISQAKTEYTAFDPVDYRTVLDSGLVTFGAMPIRDTDKKAIADALRQNLSRNVLSGGVDLKTAKYCGCLVVGQPNVIGEIPLANLNHAFETIERVLGGGIVHHGIYTADKPLSAYTIIGGLDMPAGRLDEVAKLAGYDGWPL